MAGKGTHEAEVVGSNPGNIEKIARAHTREKNHETCERAGKKKIFFWIFIHAANIYFSTQKNDARHLCVDIGDGLRIP